MRFRITSEEMPLGKLRHLEGSRGREFGLLLYACYHYSMVPFWTENYAQCNWVNLGVSYNAEKT